MFTDDRSKGSKTIAIGMKLKTDKLYVQVCDLTRVQEAPSAEAKAEVQ